MAGRAPGLKRDDILNETDVVKEAIKRLPEDEYYERIFRIKRAAQLSLTHDILPKDQWTKYEEPLIKSSGGDEQQNNFFISSSVMEISFLFTIIY
ncbi:Cytochrome b-c1 complex subunit 7, partial [Ophiophagus hannah]